MSIFVLTAPALVSAIESIATATGTSIPTTAIILPDSPRKHAEPAVQQQGLAPELVSHDLDGIISSGKLRILYSADNPYSASRSSVERLMLERFAEEHDLVLEWLASNSQWNLLPDLMAGKGDVIIGQGQSVAGGMNDKVLFTSPWMSSRQQVVVRSNTTQIDSLEDLISRQVALKRSSPVWHLVEGLAAENPTMDIVIIPEELPQEEVMQRVITGQYDLTIADSDFLAGYLPQHPELSVAYDVTNGEPKAWAVSSRAEKLQTALDQFLNKNHLEFNVSRVHLDDLPLMLERKVLRLITYRSPVNYYFSNGRFHGFEYELVRKYAKAHKMRVDVVLASTHEEMQELLLNGDGDIIAAALPTGSISNEKITFSSAYDYAAPLVIGRQVDDPLHDIRDLEGRRITLSAESPYRNLLERIRDRGINLEIVIAEPGLDTQAILTMVSRGMYDLTVLDSNKYNNVIASEYLIRAHFPLSEPAPHAWAVRVDDQELQESLNHFIQREYRGNFYNTLYAKYIENPHHWLADNKFRQQVEQLSPYDDLVRKYAEEYSFDWRLIVAQMYQESRFNPHAVSFKGAEGLMQIMPSTAEDIGIHNLDNPANSIQAGVKYLSMLRGQFENDLLLEDRTWFTVASYNAGFGRVKQARELASEMGLDPNRWFGNVEKAMLAMAQPFEKDGEMVRNCRCGETVVYVHEIRTLYNNYVRLTQSLQVARADARRTPPFDI
jgi:membrane-bound lytic murein transglycosylase F